jgi:ubiquinone/menaquinone biosynthesis C-methylase UbiE
MPGGPMTLHDKIAERYDEDYAGLLAGARSRWETQIHEVLRPQADYRVLDIAAGTGVSLAYLEAQWEKLHLSAIDLSPKMLQVARRRISSPLRCICDNALNAERHFAAESLDLILCHFLFSHVDPRSILQSQYRLLRPGGHVSIITTTKEQFRGLLEGPWSFPGRVFRINREFEKSSLVESHEDNISRIEQSGFEIVSAERHRPSCVIPDRESFWDFGFRAGWLMSVFDGKPHAKLAIVRAAVCVLDWMIPDLFPLPLTADMSLVVARKPVRARQT